MRRSTAPSFRQSLKFTSPLSPSKELNPSAKINSSSSAAASFPNAVRSTASILNLLSGEDISDASVVESASSLASDGINSADSSVNNRIFYKGSHESKHVPCIEAKNCNSNQVTSQNFQSKRVFNVVWGKQSKKKHKTWEGDGTLEVGEKTAVLKDTEGKIISQSSGLKTATLEEGSRLNVGSKEVEIIDLVDLKNMHNTKSSEDNDVSNKRVSNIESKASVPVSKKPRKTLPKSKLFSVNRNSGFKQSFQLDYKPLVMPSPTHEHQWQHNLAHLPVVDVNVDICLARVLRPHQRLGVVFLYECVMGMRKSDCYGAILADEMGLGKTLQCITLVWMLLKQGPYGGNPALQRVLIVTPSSLVINWQNEFLHWLGRERIQTFVVDQKNKPKDYKTLPRIPVMLISYEMFVRYYEDICQSKFDLLICDEGHRLKNTAIRTSTLLNQLECKRRILLTGTPIQNDLQEYYALVNFINPGVLGSNIEFRKYFEEPILASRQPSADEEVCFLGEQRTVELNQRTSWFFLRRTQEVIDKYLPTKQESIVFCRSTPLQQAMYEAAVGYWENRGNETGPEEVAHLGVITALKKICNHPSLIKSRQTEQLPGEEDIIQYLSENFPTYNNDLSPEHSGKLAVVMCLLQELSCTKEKVVLVSYFTQTLDLLAAICDQKHYTYSRLDGSTPSGQRIEIVKKFNSPYSNCFVFLLSARAGGVGLNLIGASRLVLYDSDWNPATDLQAMSRIWRDGQSKSVYIYRLLTAGSIEEKIFQRQISKTGLSGAIVDPQNTSTIRLSNAELKDLFTFHQSSNCWTHEILKCHCAGVGEVPAEYSKIEKFENTAEDLSSQRDCQLQITPPSMSPNCVRVNQLFQWQHYAQPIDTALMQELCLSAATHHITFMFRNARS